MCGATDPCNKSNSSSLITGKLIWFLGYWAAQYDQNTRVNAAKYLMGYSAFIVSGLGFWDVASGLHYFSILSSVIKDNISTNPKLVIPLYGAARGSRSIHQRLTRSVLGSQPRWLDSTPMGRITSRFTQDIATTDTMIPQMASGWFEITVAMLIKFCAVILYSPVFVLPGIAVALAGNWVAKLSVKRQMSNAKSPVYPGFHAAMAGLTSIRAYNTEDAFKAESRRRTDQYTRSARTYYNLNRWVCIRIDALGGLFAGGLAAYLVYWKGKPLCFSGGWCKRCRFLAQQSCELYNDAFGLGLSLNILEVQGNSLERIKDYAEIEQDPKHTEAGKPPAYWPSSGSLRVEGLNARYSADDSEVLHDLYFEIQSGERVGVVGRTGAGKSSLSLALLRMIPTTGKVYYDGVDTETLNLDAFRSNITNLDPFEEHDDATLNSCLQSSGFFSLQEDDEEGKIGLDSNVTSGGMNFSLGQGKSSRWLGRWSGVVKYEATASVDYKTDTAIQEAIASEFNDMTLIIVAHRLQTIMGADKILVLDAGKVVEFDSPEGLLKKEGAFKALVDGSGDRDTLYGLVKHKLEESSTKERRDIKY
ncbi:hypothetical protein FRB97_007147 [Tulasnella sp. 331]|nr:hypothetical protein FRB97_007147 [Tulasnella sp. 331]